MTTDASRNGRATPSTAADDQTALLRQLLEEVRAIRLRLDAAAPAAPPRPAPLSAREARRLTPAERDIMALMAGEPWRLKGEAITQALEDRGQRWSDVTIRRGLAHLVHLGLLRNSKKTPQGYWIPRDGGPGQGASP